MITYVNIYVYVYIYICNSNNWVMFSVATSPRQHHFYGFLVARCCFTKLNSSLRCHVSWTLAAALGSAAARCGVGQRWDASWGWIYRNLGKDWEGRRWGKSNENPMKFQWIWMDHYAPQDISAVLLGDSPNLANIILMTPIEASNKICDLCIYIYIYIYKYIYIYDYIYIWLYIYMIRYIYI
jgi:hypothetical protein